MGDSMNTPELSIIVPVLNEQDNVEPVVAQVEAALGSAEIGFEMIIVDDGSSDQTLPRLRQLATQRPWLVLLHRDRPRGQSAAMAAGIAAASGPCIGMLDGDLQNDPADLPRLFQIVQRGEADLAQGDRTEARREGWRRKLATTVGRLFRRALLGDSVRDTGCTLRVMRAELARQLPLHLRGMHRYVPIYARMLGARIVEVPVNHRLRQSGQAKYGLWDRAAVGLYDVMSVRWMLRRYRDPAAQRIEPAEQGKLPYGTAGRADAAVGSAHAADEAATLRKDGDEVPAGEPGAGGGRT